jgi:hypothetical protein
LPGIRVDGTSKPSLPYVVPSRAGFADSHSPCTIAYARMMWCFSSYVPLTGSANAHAAASRKKAANDRRKVRRTTPG